MGSRVRLLMDEYFMCSVCTFLPLLVCFTIFSSDTLAMAKETWTISQTIQTDSGAGKEFRTRIIEYGVSDYASSIVSDKESVFIDYENMRLYRLDRKTSVCRDFPLDDQQKPPSRGSIVAANLRKLMAEIAVRENGKQQRINNRDCLGMDVLLGAGLLRMKTAAPVTVEHLGQLFIETTGEYWIDSSKEIWQLFEEKIARRQTAFVINPLLKRIDPLGLIESLGGFPVHGLERSKGRRVESVLVSAPVTSSFEMIPPTECRDAVKMDQK